MTGRKEGPTIPDATARPDQDRERFVNPSAIRDFSIVHLHHDPDDPESVRPFVRLEYVAELQEVAKRLEAERLERFQRRIKTRGKIISWVAGGLATWAAAQIYTYLSAIQWLSLLRSLLPPIP